MACEDCLDDDDRIVTVHCIGQLRCEEILAELERGDRSHEKELKHLQRLVRWAAEKRKERFIPKNYRPGATDKCPLWVVTEAASQVLHGWSPPRCNRCARYRGDGRDSGSNPGNHYGSKEWLEELKQMEANEANLDFYQESGWAFRSDEERAEYDPEESEYVAPVKEEQGMDSCEPLMVYAGPREDAIHSCEESEPRMLPLDGSDEEWAELTNIAEKRASEQSEAEAENGTEQREPLVLPVASWTRWEVEGYEPNPLPAMTAWGEAKVAQC